MVLTIVIHGKRQIRSRNGFCVDTIWCIQSVRTIVADIIFKVSLIDFQRESSLNGNWVQKTTVWNRGGHFSNRIKFGARFTTEFTTEFYSVNPFTRSDSVVNRLWFEKKFFYEQPNHNRISFCESTHRFKFGCKSVVIRGSNFHNRLRFCLRCIHRIGDKHDVIYAKNTKKLKF